jgi:hypothetical protein
LAPPGPRKCRCGLSELAHQLRSTIIVRC